MRVLQLGEFARVGGEQTLKVDVRILATTNRTCRRPSLPASSGRISTSG